MRELPLGYRFMRAASESPSMLLDRLTTARSQRVGDLPIFIESTSGENLTGLLDLVRPIDGEGAGTLVIETSRYVHEILCEEIVALTLLDGEPPPLDRSDELRG